MNEIGRVMISFEIWDPQFRVAGELYIYWCYLLTLKNVKPHFQSQARKAALFGENFFNETQIFEVIELILLKQSNKCVCLKGTWFRTSKKLAN